MGGGSKTTQKTSSKTNQTQTATPYAAIQPGLDQLGSNITSAMNQVQNMGGYGGPFVAQAGALQNAVIPAYQAAAAQAGSLIDPARNVATNTVWQMPTFEGPSLAQGTQGFESYNADAIQPVINAAIQPYLRQLTEQILPSLQSSANEAGAYSNDRALVTLPGMALRDTSRMAAEVGTGIAYQDFIDRQHRLQNAYQMDTQRGLGMGDLLSSRLAMYPELINNVMRLSTGQADLTQEAANYDIAMRQAEINNSLAQDQYNAALPFRGLNEAASLYSTFQPYATNQMVGKSNSTTTTQQQQSPFSQIMQGALGLGSLAMGFPGLGGALGLGGAAASASMANPMLMAAMQPGAYISPFQAAFGG